MKHRPIGEPYMMPLYDDRIPQVGDIIYDGKGGYVKVLSVHKIPLLQKIITINNSRPIRCNIKVQRVV